MKHEIAPHQLPKEISLNMFFAIGISDGLSSLFSEFGNWKKQVLNFEFSESWEIRLRVEGGGGGVKYLPRALATLNPDQNSFKNNIQKNIKLCGNLQYLVNKIY